MIYRNYSSGPNGIFQSSGFSTQSNELINFMSAVSAFGGQGN